jgi:hypothetical protein
MRDHNILRCAIMDTWDIVAKCNAIMRRVSLDQPDTYQEVFQEIEGTWIFLTTSIFWISTTVGIISGSDPTKAELMIKPYDPERDPANPKNNFVEKGNYRECFSPKIFWFLIWW